MTTRSTAAVLNRLLGTVYHSLPMYLADVKTWVGPDAEALKMLNQIVDDNRLYAQRIADALLDRHERVESGEYPMEFTGLHDCALEYLVGQLIVYQKRDIARMEECVSELREDPGARALAEEVLGAARAHLELLEELRPTAAAATISV